MAAAFGSDRKEDKCQAVDCKDGSSIATYHVHEKQDLCETCARRKDSAITSPFCPAPSHTEWVCDKHKKHVEFFCRTHMVDICQSCVIVGHQRPCVVQDVGDAVKEKRDRLRRSLSRVVERLDDLHLKKEQIHDCSREVDKHFERVRGQITSACQVEIMKVREEESSERERLMKVADEQIRNILDERDASIQKKHDECMAQRELIRQETGHLTSSVQKIHDKARGEIGMVASKVNTSCLALEGVQQRLEKALLSDKDIIRETDHEESSLITEVETDQTIERIQRVARTAQNVRFEAGKSGMRGRISGTGGMWQQVDLVAIQKTLTKPYFIGSISEDEMVVSDLTTRSLHVVNLKEKTTKKVLECSGDRTIVSSMSLDKSTILCGNFCRDPSAMSNSSSSIKGASLYSRDWRLIRDVDVPLIPQPETGNTFATVHVTKSGKILAAVACQSEIHVINPDDATLMNTVSVSDGKPVHWLCCSATSGDFVLKTGHSEFMILDEASGAQRNTVAHSEWDGFLCCVDPIDDSIFVVYRDIARQTYAVDHVSNSGAVLARRVAEYPLPAGRKDVVLPCVVTRSRKLVTCNGDFFFVYEQK